MDKMNTLAEDQSLEKYDHPRCSWHILFATRTELHNLHHTRTANDFKDAWTALVNEYGLQEENAYLQKVQKIIDDETEQKDSQMDTNICKDVKMEVDPPISCNDVKMEVNPPKLLISHPSDHFEGHVDVKRGPQNADNLDAPTV
uniref:Uncharacterized protein n=1 Tax=Oryza meridionalis TaxID=40149 RepID=A0A0E0DZS9_9ORYZ